MVLVFLFLHNYELFLHSSYQLVIYIYIILAQSNWFLVVEETYDTSFSTIIQPSGLLFIVSYRS